MCRLFDEVFQASNDRNCVPHLRYLRYCKPSPTVHYSRLGQLRNGCPGQLSRKCDSSNQQLPRQHTRGDCCEYHNGNCKFHGRRHRPQRPPTKYSQRIGRLQNHRHHQSNARRRQPGRCKGFEDGNAAVPGFGSRWCCISRSESVTVEASLLSEAVRKWTPVEMR